MFSGKFLQMGVAASVAAALALGVWTDSSSACAAPAPAPSDSCQVCGSAIDPTTGKVVWKCSPAAAGAVSCDDSNPESACIMGELCGPEIEKRASMAAVYFNVSGTATPE